ncbi:MAG: hypothetical protein IJA94_00740 [Bacilli bacterium]|nr:hypothetical protein [Bacilli bacterium]
MNSTDIEKVATNKIEELVLKNSEILSPYINSNDRTPMWDGNIYIYNKNPKTNGTFEGKIDVQIKGRQVDVFKDNNTYSFKVETLRGYQKEIKGTLLLVVDFIDIDNYKIYYCNLLPVDLYQILKDLKEEQKNVSLKLKEINENTALNFKNVCVNFYKNSIRQANKKIIEESEFNNIEELNFEVFAKQSEYEEYLEAADVYTYAKMKGTHEEVATVKGEWKSFSTIKKNIFVNDKKFYSQYTVMGKDSNELVVGPITIELLSGKIHLKLEGTPKKRIKDLEFITNVLKEQYIMFDNVKFDLPFTDIEMVNKNIDIYSKQLNYFKKITKLFGFFNTEFDIDYDQLSEVDLRNLHHLMNLYDGVFPDDMRELQKYYININKYKFIFILVFNSNKIYNFYSQEMIDNTLCVIIRDGKEIKTSVYSNLLPEEYLNVNNFNERIILKSFKNIELNDEVLDSINLLMLSFLTAYDQSNNRKYLDLADKLSQIICKNRINDIDFINSKQIKHRKKNLSFNDKKLLNSISEKEEHMNNYPILCCIDILLNNNFEFDIHYKNMKKKDKEIFNTWPIYNLLKK